MVKDGLKLSRREFTLAGITGLASIDGSIPLQIQNSGAVTGSESTEYEFQGVADLIGPGNARPDPGDSFFDNKVFYAYRYEDQDTGAISFITQDDSAWTPLNYIQHQPVFSSDDLPEPTAGTHSLVDNTVYHFYGFVTSPYGIELGNSTPLVGRHGSVDGFIHVGGQTAITGTDAGYFSKDMYTHAPGGTIFDLTADATTEMLVESVAYSDAAGLGNIASLGTVEGFRVPTWKGCNFEDFNDGLTITGQPDKLFFSESPFRGVTASGVTIIELDANCSVDIVDVTDCYVKGVQSDTVVWDVDPSASITEIFQYRGTTHDNTVTESNILTGQADVGAVGFRVRDCHPLPDSAFRGEIDLDLNTPIQPLTGSGAGPVEIGSTGGTFTLTNGERVTQIGANGQRLRYDGLKEEKDVAHVLASVSGANTTFELSLAKNGTILDRTKSQSFNSNANTPAGINTVATLRLDTNDYVSAYLENIGGSGDLDVETFALTI